MWAFPGGEAHRFLNRYKTGNRGKKKMKPRNIIEKIWDDHVVVREEGKPDLLYIDLHLIHEVTSPQAFEGLRQNGRKVRLPI